MLQIVTKNRKVSGIIAILLAKNGVYTKETLEIIIKMTLKQESYSDLSIEAINVFRKIDNLSEETAKFLLNISQDKSIDTDIIVAILHALKKVSYHEVEMVKLLFEKLSNLDSQLVEASKEQVEKVAKDKQELEKMILEKKYTHAGIKLLLGYADSPNESIQKTALRALERVDSPSRKVVRKLLKNSKDGVMPTAGTLRNLWMPSPKALAYLKQTMQDYSNIVICKTAIQGLGRVKHLQQDILEILLKCYLESEGEINNIAYDILKHIDRVRFEKFKENVERYLLNRYGTSSIKEKRILLILLGRIPNASVETVQCLLKACGDSQEDISKIAKISLVRCLSKDENVIIGYSYDNLSIKSALKAYPEIGHPKPLGPLADFNQLWLGAILDGCGDDNAEVRWISRAIIKNFSNYENSYEEMLREKAKSKNPGIKIAAISILNQTKIYDQKMDDDLFNVALDESEMKDVRIAIFKKLPSSLSKRQVESLYKFFLRKEKNMELFVAAFEALSLKALLENYPVSEINKAVRRRWLEYKLYYSSGSIVLNEDGSLTLFSDKGTDVIKTPHLSDLQHDLEKVRLMPPLYIPNMPIFEAVDENTDNKDDYQKTKFNHHCSIM